jgi:hypothetical protein
MDLFIHHTVLIVQMLALGLGWYIGDYGFFGVVEMLLFADTTLLN